MDGDLEYQVMELAASRGLGQLSNKELMVLLQELLAERGDEPAEAEAVVWRAYEEHLLKWDEVETMLGSITVKPTPPGLSRTLQSTEPPKLAPTGPHAAKRWGS